AVVGLRRGSVAEKGKLRWFLAGYVAEILVDDIHVPLDQRPVLDALEERPWSPVVGPAGPALSPEGRSPRYQVHLRYGAGLEPWVVSIESLQEADRIAPPGD